MNRDLFLSILALDSYNRGYGQRLNFASNSEEANTQLGNATILGSSEVLREANGQRSDVEAGFYGIAYDVSDVDGFDTGETVIAYRGTDGVLRDAVNGFGIGAGFTGLPQGELAIV